MDIRRALWSSTQAQCLVLAESPVLALSRIWTMQLDGYIQRTQRMPSSTVLSGSAPLQSSENCTSSQQNNRCRVLWGRTPSPRSQSHSCYVEQAVDVLRMQHCYRMLHVSVPPSVISQVRTFIPPDEGIVFSIQSSSHSLMDENVMGKALVIRGSRRVCHHPPLLSMRWGSIPHEDTVKRRVQR
jgi:hypothetical protein